MRQLKAVLILEIVYMITAQAATLRDNILTMVLL